MADIEAELHRRRRKLSTVAIKAYNKIIAAMKQTEAMPREARTFYNIALSQGKAD